MSTNEIQEILLKHKKHFLLKSGQTLELVTRRGCAVSILGDVQKPTGYGLEQLGLADCFEEPSEVPSNFTYSVILWFFNIKH